MAITGRGFPLHVRFLAPAVSTTQFVNAAASIAGAGAVTAQATQRGSASIAGAGVVVAQTVATVQGSASIAGAGTVSDYAVQQGSASIAGAGVTTNSTITQGVAGAAVGIAVVGDYVTELGTAAVSGASVASAAASGSIVSGVATVAAAGSVVAPVVQGVTAAISEAGNAHNTTNYTQTINEIVGLTDSAPPRQTHNGFVTDIETVYGSQVFLGPGPTDTTGLTDSTYVWRYPTPTDQTGITDTFTLVHNLGVVVTDLAGVTDGPARAQQHYLTYNEAGNLISDISNASYVRGPNNQTDPAGLADSIDHFDVGKVFTELASITDTVVFSHTQVFTNSEILTDSPVFSSMHQYDNDSGLTDTASVVKNQWVPTISQETAGITDSTVIDRFPAPTDLAGVTDSIVSAHNIVLNITDNMELDDSSLTWTWSLYFTYGTGLTDNIVFASRPWSVVVTDTILVTDLYDQIDYAMYAQDFMTIVDPFTEGHVLAPFKDTLTLSDYVVLDHDPTPVDNAGITDSVVFNHQMVLNEYIGIVDNGVSAGIGRSFVVNDITGTTDTTSTGRAATLLGDAGLTDSVLVAKVKSATDLASMTDSISLLYVPFVIQRLVTDSAGLTDSFARAKSLVMNDSERMSDISIPVQNRQFTNLMSVTDSVLVEKILTFTDSMNMSEVDNVQVNRFTLQTRWAPNTRPTVATIVEPLVSTTRTIQSWEN